MDMMDVEQCKISKLNDDCLEVIFNDLIMTEIFNVAKSNKNFVETAVLVFKRKFGHCKLYIDPYKVSIYKNEKHLCEQPEIYFTKASNQFTFLRIFGKAISKMKVIGETRNDKIIKEYIKTYCPNAIVDIEFSVYFSWHANGMEYTDELNYQIANETKQIALKCAYVSDNLLEKLPSDLKSLNLYCTKNYNVNMQIKPFIFEQLRKFIFVSENVEIFERKPFSIIFVNLNELQLIGFDRLSENWMDFIMYNQNLTKLSLHPNSYITNKSTVLQLEHLEHFISKLTILEINLRLIVGLLNHLPQLLLKSSTLIELRLYWATHFDIDIATRLTNVFEKFNYYSGPFCAALIRK